MPKKGYRKRLKFRADDMSSQRVTVADYANSDPSVVKSGRMRKAVANAVQKEVKELCGLEASHVPAEDSLSVTSENGGHCGSSDELDAILNLNELTASKKKKTKRHKENSAAGSNGNEYHIDIWLVLASYIQPEDIAKFALICKNAWTVTCTAVFWMRLYKRHYRMNAYLPVRLRPERIERLRSLRACVIRSLYHMYEPFCSRVTKNPSIPESTPNFLANSKCLLFWCSKVAGSRSEAMWEFNFKFKKQFTINVSTDMRHHRVRLLFQDSPIWNGKKPRGDQGVQVILDPVHSVHLLDWWHPRYPFSARA
ncbi:transmembrane protein 183A isoform X3 [Ascaphus truei]|uniref:transmembrane protein 183A isoform X3 n=1 Tax=Ascaphus truei TaxID=8439 RepID=UPI003F5948F8